MVGPRTVGTVGEVGTVWLPRPGRRLHRRGKASTRYMLLAGDPRTYGVFASRMMKRNLEIKTGRAGDEEEKRGRILPKRLAVILVYDVFGSFHGNGKRADTGVAEH